MDDRTWLGNLAEVQAAAAYTKQRWDVFTQTGGKAPFDLIAHKEGELRCISVKGTSLKARQGAQSYIVGLRSTRSNLNGYKIKRLTSDDFDELAVYVEPLDVMVFWDSVEVDGKDQVTYNHLRPERYRFTPR